MSPADYFLQYTDSIQKSSKSCFSGNWQNMILESDFYYPFYLNFAVALNSLGRTDLLEILQGIIAIECQKKYLSRTDVQEFIEFVQCLKKEQIWRRSEMDRLAAVLVDYESKQERIMAELIESQVDRRRLCIELESCLNKLSLLENQAATLHINLAEIRESNSWKITKPLRWLSQLMKAMYVSKS